MSQLVLKHPDLKHEDLKFNTVEVHAGEPRDMYGALIPPIYQTSTFYFDSTDDAVKACDDYAESFAYSRITNPSVDYLEQKLAALEHGKGAVAYASGMGAVSGAIFALLKSGDHAIFTKAKYSGTEDVTSDWLPRFGTKPICMYTFIVTLISECPMRYCNVFGFIPDFAIFEQYVCRHT